jgi:SHS2 domain-containing protein
MKTGYRFNEEAAPSDCAVEIYGQTLSELFTQAALAVTETTVELDGIREVDRKTLVLEAEELEDLLYDWLDELVYLKDAERMVFSRYEIELDEANVKLNAALYGEELDTDRHQICADIKAVTYHKFSLEKREDGWTAFVILDL